MRLGRHIYDRLRGQADPSRRAIHEFHRLYYSSARQTWENTRWLGVNVYKTPLDLWVYQELLASVMPELIVETGTAEGGSALFLASVCDLLGRGEVVTIDVDGRDRRPHDRVTYVHGSSTAPEAIAVVEERARNKAPVMVVLDSDHSRDHVLKELRSYADFVTPGSYLVVEDTNLNGHPILTGFGPGPMEAVDEFLRERPDFVSDRSRESSSSPLTRAAIYSAGPRLFLEGGRPVSRCKGCRFSRRRQRTAMMRPVGDDIMVVAPEFRSEDRAISPRRAGCASLGRYA